MNRTFIITSLIISLGTVLGLTQLLPNDTLNLNIPFEGWKGRHGLAEIKILDPEDNIVGSTRTLVYVGTEHYTKNIKVKLTKKDLDPDLLRVRVTFKNKERVYSLFQLQDRLLVKILGQNEFIRGTPVTHRVIVTNQRDDAPVGGAFIKVVMKADGKELKVYEGMTDNFGICKTSFDLNPAVNECDLHFEVSSDIGKDAYDTRIKVLNGNQTYLVTDKPIYQPGQTIHIRALSLHKPELAAVKGRELTFEVEDSKGNKVFKKTVKTDDFGVGYVPFLLADELNFGNYTVRAILDGEKVEKTVKVEKYVLPKFKLELATDKEFYLPGERLEGDLDANYFFGKPVASGGVKITTYRYDVGFQEEAVIEGKTDENGKYHFVYTLPAYFVGEPLEKGDAFIRLDVEVMDNANHSEKISLKKKIVKDLINLSVVPEGGALKPKLENRVYVLANYPDGSPCPAQVEMKVDGKLLTGRTDDYGIAEFSLTPENASVKFEVSARDNKGQTAQTEKDFSLDVNRDQIILKMARGIFKVGESIDLTLLSTKKAGRVYLDVIKDNQTVLTKSVEISGGKGNYKLYLTPDLTGSIWLHAYIITPGGDIVRDTRFTYVHAANDLAIGVKPDQDEYLPGADGSVTFTVTDKNGKPRVAALCVAIVDEAVFAVSELQPGLEKVYFTLEKEILEPRYEIHGFEPANIVMKPPIDARAENVLFSTLTPKEPFPVNYTTPQPTNDKIRQAFYTKLNEARNKIYEAVNKYYEKYNKYPPIDGALDTLVAEKFLNPRILVDPWSRKYQITPTEGYDYFYYFTIVSAGPDGVYDDADDINESGWGWGGEGNEEMLMEDRAMPVMAAPPAGMAKKAQTMTGTEVTREKDGGGVGEEPRVREYFPETFVFEPALITDASGHATLSLTMPDAITTWRVSASASTAAGELGSTLSQIRVFQDFFVDIDLPVSLTEGDEISIPVALYNYLPREQKIKVVLQPEDWFEIAGDAEINRNLKKDEVSVAYFPIKIRKIGYHSLLVKAYGEVKSDAIKRSIEIVPNGKKFESVISDRLAEGMTKNVSFPKDAIAEANALTLKIFPGIYSQVVEGLEKMLGMPYGCFEQTSSVTYPNILILNYLRQTNQVKPETEMKAEEYISVGWQRLLSFEVKGGGFSWFGDAPANKILTAFGLMEFYDMAKVHEIDERVIDRTATWLKNQQNKDGSWTPDPAYLHEESWGRIQHNEIMPTAYVCWALGEIGQKGAETSRGLDYLKNHLADAAKDPYIMALVANAFAANDPKSDATMEVLKQLVGMAKEKDGAVWWESGMPTATWSRGDGAAVEASGLALYALIRAGKFADMVTKGLTYLIRSKEASGMWPTTQGTIISMRALVAVLGGLSEDVNADVVVMLNGKKVKELKVDKTNSDVMQQIDLTEGLVLDNKVEVTVKGKGSFMYELTGTYYRPWDILPKPPVPPFDIAVKYDRTSMSINDLVNVNVSVRLNRPGTAQMVMVDLGIPPGFEVQTPTLDELVGKKIQKYSITARQIIIYLESVSSDAPVKLAYSLKAKYPIKAKVRSSRVYEYYNSGDESVDPPFEMKVGL
jgi:hypothetical protein